jgi:hypothetical protein
VDAETAEMAFRNWYRLLTPGGRMVAIYGLSAATGSAPQPGETRQELTAMYLADHQPLVSAAGYRDIR